MRGRIFSKLSETKQDKETQFFTNFECEFDPRKDFASVQLNNELHLEK